MARPEAFSHLVTQANGACESERAFTSQASLSKLISHGISTGTVDAEMGDRVISMANIISYQSELDDIGILEPRLY
jgi:hypothetical protein